MKVVVTDSTFTPLDIEAGVLEPLGHCVVGGQGKTPDALIDLVHDADAVITQFAPITSDVIAAMQKARVIVRYGIGVDNVDLDAARRCGIPVCNVPDYCTDEVADHTLAFILSATRQLVAHCLEVRAGKWQLAAPLAQLRTLCDLTVGIVGFGRIGREVAARLAPFKCRRLVCDPHVAPQVIQEAGCEAVDLEQALAEADILTLHCPSTQQTKRMLNASAIARMKRGALLINLARGDLVDTGALIEALQAGHLSGAALDVCDPEPIPAGSPLLRMANVILTPHIASASVKAVQRLRESAARLAASALSGGDLSCVVNGVPTRH